MKTLRALLTLFFIAISADILRASTCFDDQSLAQLMPARTGQRPVLIYVWSPRMVYSLHNMHTASRAAAAAGMDFVVLHDSRVPPEELLNVPPTSGKPSELDLSEQDLATPPFVSLQENSLPLCAPALFARDALRHFPTAFVLTPRGIHAQPIVGAMPPSAWQLSIAQRLQF